MAEYLSILCPVGVVALMLLLGLGAVIPRLRGFRARTSLLCPFLISILACVWVADLLWLYGKFKRVNHAYLDLRLDRISEEELVKRIGFPPDRVVVPKLAPGTPPEYGCRRLVYFIRVPFMRTSAGFLFGYEGSFYKVDPQPGDIPSLVTWFARRSP